MNDARSEFRATSRINLALLTMAILEASRPVYIGVGAGLADPIALFASSA
jgi:hypothetical protein